MFRVSRLTCMSTPVLFWVICYWLGDSLVSYIGLIPCDILWSGIVFIIFFVLMLHEMIYITFFILRLVQRGRQIQFRMVEYRNLYLFIKSRSFLRYFDFQSVIRRRYVSLTCYINSHELPPLILPQVEQVLFHIHHVTRCPLPV